MNRPDVNLARLRPWTRMIVDVLAQGPQSIEPLVVEASTLVPPGRAFRRYDRKTYRSKGDRPVSDDKRIQSGQRWVVYDSVHAMTIGSNPSLRRFMVDGVGYIELTDTGKRRFGIGGSDGREDQGDPHEG